MVEQFYYNIIIGSSSGVIRTLGLCAAGPGFKPQKVIGSVRKGIQPKIAPMLIKLCHIAIMVRAHCRPQKRKKNSALSPGNNM